MVTGPQQFEHRARCREFVDRPVAKLCAHTIDKLLDLWVVEPARQKRERVTEQRDAETRHLPRAEMTGVVDQTVATLGPGVFEILPSDWFNELPEIFSRPRRHLAEKSELPAQTLKT